MKNHLFIGLGGQGGKTIGELRKVIASRENDVKTLKEQGTNWDFLYIDSSRDVTKERGSWTHFGENLSLNPDSFLYLKDDGQDINAASMAQQPDIAPWIGDHKKLDDFLKSTQGIVGANQRRRLGRLLFARNADRIKKSICEDKITPMLGSNNSCAIHIFASLAGGTGSGGIVDLVTMLRKEYANTSTEDGFPIFLYLYVTEREFQNAKVGNFHENQAACLRDLNALACANYHPNLLGSAINGERFSGTQPLTQILLSTHLNGRGLLSIEQQHQIFAEATFERIYCYSTSNLKTDEQKALTGEDIIAAFPGEPARMPMRSYRFASSGMRRWEVPIDEVRELLASKLLSSSIKTILYQNWSNVTGAVDEKLSSNIQGYDETLNSVITSVVSEKSATTSLSSLMDKLKEDVNLVHSGMQREGFKDVDLDEYEKSLNGRYIAHLDGKGVEAVFAELSQQRKRKVERIKSTIHEQLKQASRKSSEPLGIIYLHDLLNEAQSGIRAQIDDGQNDAGADQALESRMQRRKAEWDKLTFISRLFKQNNLANSHKSDTLSMMRQDLRRRAHSEDREMLTLLARDIGNMASAYKLAADFLVSKSEESSNRSESLLGSLKALKSNPADRGVGKAANKAEFEFSELEAHLDKQSIEKDLIRNTCDEFVTKSIDEVLGDDRLVKLGRFSEAQKEKFDEAAETLIYKRCAQIHDVIIEREHSHPVLSGNILDILQKKFNEDSDSFKKDLKEFIESSASSIQLMTSSEIQPRSLRSDEGMPPMPRQFLIIGIPSGHPFGGQLKEIIKPLMAAGNSTYCSVYEHDDSTQLRMLTMTYWMAARYVKTVHSLEAMYEKSLKSDNDGDRAYFTNLDTSGEKGNRPAMLLPTAEESQSQVRAALWLGGMMLAPETEEKLIQESPDGVTLIEASDKGITPVKLGETLEELKNNVDVIKASRIISAVEASLSSLDPEKIESIRADIKGLEREFIAKHGATSPEFMAWTQDREHIHKLLN
ncbi:tubulin-like doman-containing protein [Akkermansiaceae bacterium]|nr:tubulin-like doman-containing protein [Akkermansiaceae bacterium]MDC1405508.1 tubulin-like doman-containing protein [Akkermansiaceae bacterium]